MNYTISGAQLRALEEEQQSDTRRIVLSHETKPSDYGENVTLTGWRVLYNMTECDDRYEYILANEGCFRRSTSYWWGSPYGWHAVLPRHMNSWGLQT